MPLTATKSSGHCSHRFDLLGKTKKQQTNTITFTSGEQANIPPCSYN